MVKSKSSSKENIMTSFIIYDSDLKRREIYLKVIRRFLYTSLDYYTIYEFDRYSIKVQEDLEHIEGTKVYLVNADIEGGMILAKKIRSNGDFISPLIFFTSKNRKDVLASLRNILYLDVIETGDQLISDLMQSLVETYKIVTRHSVYTFMSFDEVYRLPYNDIYYIQKNLNDDSVTIYTKDDTYTDYVTIKALVEKLEVDPRFFKVHRSCIINLYNVASFDKKSNTIIFNNGMSINLVSRYNKAILVERLKECGDTKNINVV